MVECFLLSSEDHLYKLHTVVKYQVDHIYIHHSAGFFWPFHTVHGVLKARILK